MEKKITKREMFEFIQREMGEYPEVVEFCDKEIALLDSKSAKARARSAAKAAEADAMMETIFSTLNVDEFRPISEIAVDTQAAMGEDVEITTSKVTARLTKLFNAGRVEKQQISIVGADGKSKKVMGYMVRAEA